VAIVARSPLAALVRDDEVHRRVYTDPDVFAAEMRRVFGRTWVCVGHESEVPNPGDFKTDEIARQPIVMTRHVDGEVYVLFNACRHRGALVCLEPYGSTRQFRCLYHGWTYANNGALVSVPRLANFEGSVRPSDYGLLPVPRVAKYRGFVFASLSPDGMSLDEHLGRAKVYLDLMVDRAPEGVIQAAKPLKYEYPGNWKLQLENYADNYHPAILHEAALSVDREIDAERGLIPASPEVGSYVIERSYGHGHGMAQYAPALRGWRDAFDDPEYVAALARRHGPERAAALAATDIHIMIYPNLLLHSRVNHYRLIKPLAVDHTEINTYPCKLAGAPDRVNAAVVRRTSEHVSAAGKVQIDDMKAFDCLQQGLRVEALEWILFRLRGQQEHLNADGEWECFGPSESIQRGQHREWARLMSEE
jgi:phenylpropionate dioxygenase-like ring-hydroxylating dioxygenase large terminal subunit